MQRRSLLMAALGAVGGGGEAWANEVLDRPARTSALAARRLVTGIARAGDALVAVGQRGHIVRSANSGWSWTQAAVPVSSDLTAVRFVDAEAGYATGHDGVVLGTRDGGRNWKRLLDGRTVNWLVLEHMKKRAAAAQATEQDRKLLGEAQRNLEAGPDKPFLDLCFANVNEGFVVGAYGLVMHTADGGRQWTPWFDRIDNPQLLNLYAICASGGALYVAGEAGLLLKLDREAGRFVALASPYKGSLFGLTATSAGVLAWGMRGNAFLGTDGGAAWASITTDLSASIVGAAVASDGTVALADQSGGIVASKDGGRSFLQSRLRSQAPLAALAFAGGNHALVVGGPRGLATLELAT